MEFLQTLLKQIEGIYRLERPQTDANVTANGPAGPNDYSNWTYTYNETYHNITAGINELTSKITCFDNPTNITKKYYSVNVTGS